MSGGHDRQSSEAPEAPSHVVAEERRAGIHPGPSEAALLALQRTAGNAAVAAMLSRQPNDRRVQGRALQRAVIGIHGPTDTAENRAVTEACFATLTKRKTFKADGKPLWSAEGSTEVRGDSIIVEAQRAASGSVWVIGSPPRTLLSSARETIYVLGHGVANSSLVADMTPDDMTAFLRRWFPKFRGKIKLVACYSGAEFNPDDSKPITPYALELVARLGPESANDKFRPESVDGIVGIGWIDEVTGVQMSIDDARWNEVARRIEKERGWKKGKGDDEIQKAFMEVDPIIRKIRIRALFGSAPGIIGPGGKRRYAVPTFTA